MAGAGLQRLLRDEITSLTGHTSAGHTSAGHTSAGHTLRFKAFPIRGYAKPAPLAAPHVLLVGDAAGVDPLMGEGISFALEYGKMAAAEIIRAAEEGDFSFAGYTEGIRYSWMGKRLARLAVATKLFYGRTHRLWFALAGLSPQAQEVGLKWYNGVDGWHQRSGWEAVKAVSRAIPRAIPQAILQGWKR